MVIVIKNGKEVIDGVEGDKTFEDYVNTGKLVIADFTASWCPPCKGIAPTFQEFSETYTDVTFLKVDGDENSDLTTKYVITAYPTFIFFKDGKQIEEAKILGAYKDKLEENIKTHR